MKHLGRSLMCGALATLAPFACKTASPPSASKSSIEAYEGRAEANKALKALLATYNPYQIQDSPNVPDDCGSFYTPVPADIDYRGTALLLHGFTACPQQFYEMSLMLAQKGYASFVPLLPGQGRAPVPLPNNSGKVGDMSNADYYSQFIPVGKNDGWKRYASFISEANDFMAKQPGEKVVAGLSVGAAIATLAYLDRPGIYQRALINSPFYGMNSTYLGKKGTGSPLDPLKRVVGSTIYHLSDKVINDLSKSVDLVGNVDTGWGDKCYDKHVDQEGVIARRGICDFRVSNIAALNDMGADILERLQDPGFAQALPQVQYVGVEWDSAIDTGLMRRALAYQQRAGGQAQANSCWYQKAIPHALFSRRDLSKEGDHNWLPSYLTMATEYLTDGKAFQLGSAGEEWNFDAKTEKDSKIPLSRCAIF